MSGKPTAEQLQNAMSYGVCRVCKAPREIQATERLNKTGFARKDGEPEFIIEHTLVCPNGHPQ